MTSSLPTLAASSMNVSRYVVRGASGVIGGQVGASLASRAASLSFAPGPGAVGAPVSMSSQGAPVLPRALNTWIEVTGFEAADGVSSRSLSGRGVQIGADIVVGAGMVAGLSVGLDDISAVSGAISQSGRLVHVQPYFGYRSGSWSGEATVIHGRGSFEEVSGGGTGGADVTLTALTLRGGYDFAFGAATITPSIGLALGRQEVEGKTGALAGTGTQTSEYGELSLGLRYTRRFEGGSYFAGFHADLLETRGGSALLSPLLVDDGWTGRIELGGSVRMAGGLLMDGAFELGGLGGDMRQGSAGLRVTFRF